MQLVSDDVVNEALESDHLALQNMSGSKYVQVQYFCVSMLQLQSNSVQRCSASFAHRTL